MGRVLKRVALDFDYPLKKVWEGYLNKKKYEPPNGEGYQLWETTTEGSPLSPVFTSLESLCVWCERNTTTFGKYTATKEEWYEMLSNNNVHATKGNIIWF